MTLKTKLYVDIKKTKRTLDTAGSLPLNVTRFGALWSRFSNDDDFSEARKQVRLV